MAGVLPVLMKTKATLPPLSGRAHTLALLRPEAPAMVMQRPVVPDLSCLLVLSYVNCCEAVEETEVLEHCVSVMGAFSPLSVTQKPLVLLFTSATKWPFPSAWK